MLAFLIAFTFYSFASPPCSHSFSSKQLVQKAQQGNPTAQYHLGLTYYRGTKAQKQKALEWLEQAARQNHLESQFALAFIYELNQNSQSIYWYEQAAEQGHLLARFHLALLHLTGKGTEINIQTARNYLLTNIEKGHQQSHTLLRILNQTMQSLPKRHNHKTQSKFNTFSQNTNPTLSIFKVLFGIGEQQNFQQAYNQLFSLKNSEKNKDVYFLLALMSLYGIGTQQNFQQAQYWHKKFIESHQFPFLITPDISILNPISLIIQ